MVAKGRNEFLLPYYIALTKFFHKTNTVSTCLASPNFFKQETGDKKTFYVLIHLSEETLNPFLAANQTL